MATEIEDKASSMGWSPKEQFRGDPDRWMDAETFVKRGEEFIPFLKANNRKLEERVTELSGKLQSTESLLKASAESIDELKKFNTEMGRKAAKEQTAGLIAKLAEAKRAGDVEAEVAITDQLTDHKVAVREADAAAAREKPAAKIEDKPNPETQTPEWKAWAADNEWWGADEEKTQLAIGVAAKMRKTPSSAKLSQAEFLNKVSERVDELMGGNQQRNGAGKVEGARGSASEGGSGAKTYSNLPADAKAACDRQAARLVGKGRAFEKIADWQKHYATQYFEE